MVYPNPNTKLTKTFGKDECKIKKFSNFLFSSCYIQNNRLPLHQQIPPASRKISVPSGTFFIYGNQIYASSHNHKTGTVRIVGDLTN